MFALNQGEVCTCPSRALVQAAIHVQPTILEGHNRMRICQEEIFGSVVSVTIDACPPPRGPRD